MNLNFRRGALAAFAGLAVFAFGCAPAAQPTPTTAPAKPAAPPPASASPSAAVASPVAKPSPSAAASQPAAKVDSAAWQQIVDAAKREAQVIIVGGASSELRDELVNGFTKRYPDIKVEYTGLPGPQVAPKITAEVSAGRAQTDLLLTGTTTILESLVPAGAVDELRPWLVGPETQDQSAWRGGKFTFSDEAGRYNMLGISYVKPPLIYNPTLVNPDELKSFKDIVNPKWKGKIAMLDPRQAGGGLSNATFWYTTPELGKDFLRQLFTQEITISRDNLQLVNWVGQAQYAMAIGVGEVETTEAIRKGLPVKHIPGDAMKEGAYTTPGNGSLAVVKNPPHPNATKVFLDWLVSREGSTAWSKGSGYPSLRTDALYDGPAYLVPKPGVNYQDNGSEKYVTLRKEVVDYLETVIPK